MFQDGGFFMAGMHLLWWMFWIALIGVAVFFYGWGGPGAQQRRGPRETPREVLRRRLASGEITPAEYEERKAMLDRDSVGKD